MSTTAIAEKEVVATAAPTAAPKDPISEILTQLQRLQALTTSLLVKAMSGTGDDKTALAAIRELSRLLQQQVDMGERVARLAEDRQFESLATFKARVDGALAKYPAARRHLARVLAGIGEV